MVDKKNIILLFDNPDETIRYSNIINSLSYIPQNFDNTERALEFLSDESVFAAIVQYNLNERKKLKKGEPTYFETVKDESDPSFEKDEKPVIALEDAVRFAREAIKIDNRTYLIAAEVPQKYALIKYLKKMNYDLVLFKDYPGESVVTREFIGMMVSYFEKGKFRKR